MEGENFEAAEGDGKGTDNGAEGRATDVLRQHVAALERLVEALESQADIGRERIEVLLGQRAGAEDRRAAGRDGASRCKGS